nr:pentatricopeptide repeat-containing protein At3g61360 [Tanacetum cinerariifolium]
MNEMEENNILPDHFTFHTMFSEVINSSGINGVLPLYYQMIGKNFVPKTPTVVMLMTLFCKNREVNEALDFLRYLIERGDCPHSHVVVVLLKGLCSGRRVEEGFQCGLQILEKGRFLSKTGFRVLERFLLEMGDEVKLRKLNRMIKKLQIAVPASRGHAMGSGFLGQDLRTDLLAKEKRHRATG